MARKIVNTKEISHEEWVQLRKKSLGGSDAAACVNMNPYSGLLTLYSNKIGLSKDKEDNEAMRLGRDLEQYVAERFTDKTAKKVRNDYFMYADDDVEFLTANIDRRVVGENAGLECKTMGSFNGYNIEAGEIPSQYYAQCQHYMMVMGFDRVYLAILVLQRGLYTVEIERDDDFIKSLRAAEIAFWKGYVEPGIMPEPESESDFNTLKEIYPEAIPETEIVVPGLDHLIKDFKAYGELERQYREKKLHVQSQICAKLGKAEVGIGLQYECSWKNQSKSTVNTKKLKAAYPDIYNEIVEVSDYRVFRTKEIKRKEA